MDYREAVSYLKELEKFGSILGTTRAELLLERLERPQDKIPLVHVAGSNGKGSTAAMIASVLKAAGYRVGLYTSPHLSSYTERIQVNGQAIEEGDFARVLTEIKPFAEQVALEAGIGHPTEFEVLTAAAFYCFKHFKTDVAVIEVGLGGRLDATNIITPAVSVITHITLEHSDILGNSVAAITREKAGIIKEKIPIVSAGQEPEAEGVIMEVSSQKRAPLKRMGTDITVSKIRSLSDGIMFDVQGWDWSYKDLKVSLIGDYQAQNASTAIGAVKVLCEQGFQISEKDIRQGLFRIHWPGRMELLKVKPAVLLDVAHNPDGIRALINAIQIHFPEKEIICVFGALADKDVKMMASILAKRIEKVIITRPKSQRGLEPKIAAACFQKLGLPVVIRETIEEAVDLAFRMSKSEDLLLICGSFYVVGPVRDYLLK